MDNQVFYWITVPLPADTASCTIDRIIRKTYCECKAVKCNASRIVLETFATLGIGFDCASKEEIRKILALGVSPDKIIFSNVTKLISHIKYAAEVGVTVMTFDNELELYKIKKHHLDAKLVLRIKFDDQSATIILGSKFGANADLEASNLLKTAKALNLNVIGVHFHVGSDCNDYTTYYRAISTAKNIFDTGFKLGYRFKLLDIGGGFPGETLKPISEVAKFVNKGIDDYFPDGEVKIIAEPGKYCCNAAFQLVSQIHSKNIILDANEKIRKYYVDVGVYNAFLNVLYQVYYKCRPVILNQSAEVFRSIIWGATLHKRDRISEKFDLLPDLKIGDWIIFEEIGAYSLPLACEYHGLPAPKLYAVINRDDWILLTEKMSKPLSKDRFTASLQNFATQPNIPYSFRKTYF